LLAPQAINMTSPGHCVRSLRILGFANAHREIVGLRPKAADPAASTSAIPKGASPSRECALRTVRECALRTTAAGGPCFTHPVA